MKARTTSSTWIREELLHLLTLSGTMAGLSITAIALMHTTARGAPAATVADDVLALCALMFLLCTYVIFWALRTRRPGFAQRLSELADAMFLLALTAMIGAGLIMVYTLW